MFRTKGSLLLDIWRVTWWKWSGPVSCVWHFDPGHWSLLADLRSVCMPVRPYVCTDVSWQIHEHQGSTILAFPLSEACTYRHKFPHKHVITWQESAYRVVIIALLGPCLWGHLDGTQDGRCLKQKEHFHLLCEIRVSNLIMTQGHTLLTLEERKCVLELCFLMTPAFLTVANGCSLGIYLGQPLTSVMWLVGVFT